MKKSFLTLGAAFISISSFAQRQGLWVSPQITIGGGTMTDIYPSSYSPDASAIFNFGADAYWMFNNHFGVGTGLNYGGYGAQWSSSGNMGNAEYKPTQVTADIPIFIRLVTGNKGGFFAHLGVANSFLLTAQEKVTLNGTEIVNIDGKEAKNDFRSFSLSPFVYFGGNIGIGNKVQMTIGPQIQYQINNNFSSGSGLDGHYLTFALKVGVGIHAYSMK